MCKLRRLDIKIEAEQYIEKERGRPSVGGVCMVIIREVGGTTEKILVLLNSLTMCDQHRS